MKELIPHQIGDVTLITSSPVKMQKINGVLVLVEVGLLTELKRLLKKESGIDAAQELGINQKKIVRLKRGLGLPIRSRTGSSRTTKWRKERKGKIK